MADNKINVGGRLHSIATGNVLGGANEIFDDSKNKKQSEINTETYSLVNDVNERLSGLSPDQQSALSVAAKATNNETKLGYYVCDTEGNVAAKVISNATGYVLSPGGSMKVKMTNANTVNNATLNINSTGAKALYYDGERASANNSWEAGETIEVYYDGTSFYANSVAGGSGSGDGAFDVSVKYPTSGVEGGNTYTLEGALSVLNDNLPASKKKGGMSIKFVQSSDHKYVQYMYNGASTAIADFTNTDNWEKTNLYDEVNKLNREVLGDFTKEITWSNGYINYNGEVKSSTASIYSQPFLLKAGEKITVGTRNTNITIIGSTNADSLSINDTVTPIKKTTSADQFETYTYTATEDVKIVVSVRASEYTLSFYNEKSYNSVLANADSKPVPESEDFIKSGGVAKTLGIYAEDSIAGNGSDWRTKSYSSRTIKAGELSKIKITGPITFAGTLEGQSFLVVQLKKSSDNSVIKTFYNITGATAFADKEEFYTPSYDCYLYIEGRWHTNENLNVILHTGLFPQVEKNTNDIIAMPNVIDGKVNAAVNPIVKKIRGAAWVIHSSSINFNNTTHQVEISGLILANQTNNERLTVQKANIDYNFSAASTTAYWLVYDISQSAYTFVSAGKNTNSQVVVATLGITGNSSATPNTSKVIDVVWCPIRNLYIDGRDGKSPIIDQYNEADYWVDGNKWVAKDTNYGAIIIPYSGAQQIKVTANSNVACRIAFANTYDPSSIVSGTTVIDGTGNQSTAAGQTKTINVPSTCNYIVVNRRYGSTTPNALPVSLAIDGIEYMKGVQDALIDTSKTAHDANNKVNNLISNDVLAKANTALSILRGAAMVVNCRMNFDNANHRVEMSGMTLANRGDSTRLTVPAINVDYNFNAASTTSYSFVYDFSDGAYKFVSTGTQNINQVVLATLGITGNSSATPNTSKVNSVVWSATIKCYIDGVNTSVIEAIYNSIIDRNISRDAAVRAVGKKAVNADIPPLSFIHVSDIHTKGDNYKCFESACAYYEHYSNIKAMITTGDLVYDTYADAMTWYDIALQKTTKPVLNVIGNHDSGQYNASKGIASQSSDKQCYDKYIAPYVGDWNVVQPSNAATEGKSYYYKDFTDEKIRLIVLNEFETDYEINQQGTGLVYSREFRAMRQAQVTWLINTLSSTPNDYGVIVAYHQPDNLAEVDNEFVSFNLVGSYRSAHGSSANIANVYCDDKEWLPKILNAFATKSSLTLTVTQTGAVVTSSPTLVCDCDFTSVQAEFICILNGHTHQDYIGHLTNFPALKVLCVGADNLLYTSGFQPRAAGTPSEDLFNVVNIDRNRKTIKIIRIGSDASVTGQVRDQMIMSYATT